MEDAYNTVFQYTNEVLRIDLEIYKELDNNKEFIINSYNSVLFQYTNEAFRIDLEMYKAQDNNNKKYFVNSFEDTMVNGGLVFKIPRFNDILKCEILRNNSNDNDIIKNMLYNDNTNDITIGEKNKIKIGIIIGHFNIGDVKFVELHYDKDLFTSSEENDNETTGLINNKRVFRRMESMLLLLI